ncbi:hypothetical protein C8R46DRAFT_1046775 [Mycena filopes]|nr:hypothetical protein C8R46DRAFT_1046775 [Mycena filopes]
MVKERLRFARIAVEKIVGDAVSRIFYNITTVCGKNHESSCFPRLRLPLLFSQRTYPATRSPRSEIERNRRRDGASSPGYKNKTGIDECRTMSGDKPYAAPGSGGALRYGGKEGYAEEKGGNPAETSQSAEGAAGRESGGRKPEGR